MSAKHFNILVAVDGSDSAEVAFSKAVDIAIQDDASLLIAHVIDTRNFSTFELYDLATERAEHFGQRLLKEYKEKAALAGLRNVKTTIEYGSPKVKISKTIAPQHNIDLIVCGATGMNRVERLLMGSVSEHITRHAPCDVLVVRGAKVPIKEGIKLNIGDKILKHRLESNLTIEELAVKVRIGSGLMQQIEEGQSHPDVQTLLKISTALDIPASEFLEKETIEALKNVETKK
ncbi:universal stress protein [Guptibacillus hwajinpoensis]|uniref:universal stress protein n=1 Tax=Guptibacillus hwajinpoensis TaxID=208199 RepID=UPI000B04786D|nr:universal stress protein [Alkalihalobacillus macyae]